MIRRTNNNSLILT